MTNLARMQDAAGRHGHLDQSPRVFRFPDEKPWRRFSMKARKLILDWAHSIAAAAMIVTLLLVAATAILIILYAVVFLAAFVMSIIS
jgi:hypothetical protein